MLSFMRMSKIGLVALLATAACGPAAKATPLPAGTYHYESRQRGASIDSTVTVSRDADAIVVREDARVGNLIATTIENRLDPKTLSVVAFSVRNDPDNEEASITIRPAGATYRLGGSPAFTVPPPVPEVPSWVLANWASPLAIVPALVHATGAKTLAVYQSTVFHRKALANAFSVADVTVSRPDAAPANDASLGLALLHGKEPLLSFWYDPDTFVVDAVKMNDQTVFVRKP
jgi:hypothetical protein